MKTKIISLVFTVQFIFSQVLIYSQEVKRNPDNRKDYANVFFNPKYTLFDYYTDEPIFPESDGNYHIYIASNENKVPNELNISENELSKLYFYKFKNYQNCKDWCEGKLFSKGDNLQSNSLNTSNDKQTKVESNEINVLSLETPEEIKVLPNLSFLREMDNSTKTGGWITNKEKKLLAYTDKNAENRRFEWEGKKVLKMVKFKFKYYINGIGKCSLYQNNELLYVYQGKVKNGKFNDIGILLFNDGSTATGYFKEGIRQGDFEIKYKDGTKATCNYSNNQRDGKLTYEGLGGLKVELNYTNGVLGSNSNFILFKKGGSYNGGLNDYIQFHGKGILKSKDSSIYVGEFKNGYLNGNGTLTYPEGIKIVGTWEKDMLKGSTKIYNNNNLFIDGYYTKNNIYDGTLYLDNGYKYIGNFKNGKYDGSGKMYNSDGKLIYEGGWSQGNLYGTGTEYLDDGSIYYGEYKNNKRNGKGKLTEKSGQVLEGEFKDDFVYGKGSLTTPEGVKYVGEFNKSVAEGNGELYFVNGERLNVTMKNGKPNGHGTYYYTDGTSKHLYYVDGIVSEYALSEENVAKIEEEWLRQSGVKTPESKNETNNTNLGEDEDPTNFIISKLSAADQKLYYKVINEMDSDPKNIIGDYCGKGSARCQWCNRGFTYNKQMCSRISDLKLMNFGKGLLDLQNTIYNMFSGKKDVYMNKLISEVKSNLNLIRKGNTYYCGGSEPKFCSERCEFEYSLNH